MVTASFTLMLLRPPRLSYFDVGLLFVVSFSAVMVIGSFLLKPKLNHISTSFFSRLRRSQCLCTTMPFPCSSLLLRISMQPYSPGFPVLGCRKLMKNSPTVFLINNLVHFLRFMVIGNMPDRSKIHLKMDKNARKTQLHYSYIIDFLTFLTIFWTF